MFEVWVVLDGLVVDRFPNAGTKRVSTDFALQYSASITHTQCNVHIGGDGIGERKMEWCR